MKLYRYNRNTYSILGEDGVIDGIPAKVELLEFYTFRETKCFWFIKIPYRGTIKKVSKTAMSTFAYDTKEKAAFNFLKRCERSLGLCKINTKIAKVFLKKAKEMQKEFREVEPLK